MPDTFDGYSEWLGVATVVRPLSHYQLLGLKDFESDRSKIVAAAEAALNKMRGVVMGGRLDEWQRILDELSVAKLVLCDAARKGQYDGQLRSRPTATPRSAPAGSAMTGAATGGAGPAARPSGPEYALPPSKGSAGQRPAAAGPGSAPVANGPAAARPRASLASLGFPADQQAHAQAPSPAPEPQPVTRQPQITQPQVTQAQAPMFQPQPAASQFGQPQTTFPSASQPIFSQQPFAQPQAPQPAAVRPMPLSESPAAPAPLTWLGVAPAAAPGPAFPTPNPGGAAPSGVLRPVPLPAAPGPGADGVIVRNSPRPVSLAGRGVSTPGAVPEPARTLKTPGGKQPASNQQKIIIAAAVGALLIVGLIVLGGPRAPQDDAQVSQVPPKSKHLNPLGDPAEADASRDPQEKRSDDDDMARRTADGPTEDSDAPAAKPKPKSRPKRQPHAADESDSEAMPAGKSKPPAAAKPAAGPADPDMASDNERTKPVPNKPAGASLARNDQPAPTSTPAPEKPAGESEATPEQTAAFDKALLNVRSLLAGRNVDGLGAALQQAKSLARSPEQHKELTRIEEFAGYVAGFWNAVRESMKGLQLNDEIKIGSTVLVVVSADQSEVTFHRPGRNDTYTVANMPGGVAFALAERWYDKVNPVNKIYLGAFHAADPSGDPAEARRLWEAANKSGASATDLMPLLDAPRVRGADAMASDDKPEKAEKSALAKAERAFNQKYGAEVRAAGTPQERLELADKLLLEAKAAGDPVEQSVMFRKVCELVSKVAISNATPEDAAHGAAERGIQLIDQALEEKRPEGARALTVAVIMAARKSKDETLIKDATERSKKLQEAIKQQDGS